MSFKYHGNYCGPGYTGGEFADKGDYPVAPHDSLDSRCRTHDMGYEFGNQHDADHDLLDHTSWGLNKEGLLKLGFTLKDQLYNNLVMPRNKEQKMLKPLAKAINKLDVAIQGGRRLPRARPALYRQNAQVLSRENGSQFKYNNGKHRQAPSPIESDEMVGVISGVSSATVPAGVTYAINPGNATTFPLLSRFAQNFEKYRFERLEFYYHRQVSEFSTAGTEGSVILSVDYDASDSPPTTITQAMDYWTRTDFMPCTQEDSKKVHLHVNCDLVNDSPNGKYIRTGSLPSGTDVKTYDGGNLFALAVGNASTGALGMLRVKYKVWLLEPIFSPVATVQNINNSITSLQTTAAESLTTTVNLTAGSVSQYILAPNAGLSNGIGVVLPATGILTMPAGNYLISVRGTFSSTGGFTANSTTIMKNASSLGSSGESLTTAATSSNYTSVVAAAALLATDTITVLQNATFTTGSMTVETLIVFVSI